MDLLFRRYASPFEFMHLYFKQGRFGEFVENVIKKENEQKIKENEDRMWMLYVHSFPDKSFNEWKASVLRNTNEKTTGDVDMTEKDIEKILNKLF